MNWMLSLIFLSCIVIFYYFFGSAILSFFSNENDKYSFAWKIIIGFIGSSAVQWCIGFPAQLFHLSWNVYAIVLGAFYIGVGIYIWYVFKQKHLFNIKEINFKSLCFRHIKQYWFIYVLVIFFSLFSMTSQLPYFEMNYDDHYYIGRIIQEIGSSHLATENYFSGIEQSIGFDRIITTYEIGYGFWADLFSIDPSFFARATMVILNYYLAFMSFQVVASMFIKRERYAQYGLIAIAILIIPAGHLWINKQTMMYDGWQINTAIWYGSSIVRLMAIPVILMVFSLIKEQKSMLIALFIATGVAFLSYSAIAIPIYVLLVLNASIYYLLRMILKSRGWKYKLLAILLLVSIGVIIFGVAQNNLQQPIFEKIHQAAVQFSADNENRLKGSQIFIPSVVVTILALFTVKRANRAQLIILIMATGCMFLPAIIYILSITSLGYFFVIARTFTAIQIILLVISGTFLVCLIERIKYITPIMIVILFTLIIDFQFSNLVNYQKITFIGSGISKSGYSLTRLLENPYMIPTIYMDMHEFFEKQPEERYQVITPQTVNYEHGILHLNSGLVMTANNVENCNSNYATCASMTDEEKQSINEFLVGEEVNNTEILNTIEKVGIDYILVEEKNLDYILENLDVKIVMETDSLNYEKFYLLEIHQ